MSAQPSNPLLELHQKADAEFQAYGQVQIVGTFGEPEAEYAAIRKAAALIDQPHRGVLELSGKDRLPFLNNLITNQTWDKASKSGLEAGQGVYAFFLGKNGRIIAEMNVLERGDRTLLEMDARLVEPVSAAFDRYLFGEQVKFTDRIGSLHQIAIHGPGAWDIIKVCSSPEGEAPSRNYALKQAIGTEPAELTLLGSMPARMYDTDVIIWRDDQAGVPGYHLLMDSTSAVRIWSGLLEEFGHSVELGRRPLRPAGWAAFNATRVEAGRPIFGIDFDDTILPHETGQIARAVSFTKGCYLGQEIVARMQARGQFAKQLVGIKMMDDSLPIAGAIIYDDADNQIGGITSSTVSPVLSNTAICLAFVKKNFTPVGTILTIPAEGKMRKGSVAELPFIR
jgi:folate-binding protein YgfZ